MAERTPNFLGMATAQRMVYEHVEAEAMKRPNALRLDAEEAASAEIVTFLLAACMAAHECGLPRETLTQILGDCITDVWKDAEAVTAPRHAVDPGGVNTTVDEARADRKASP